MKLSDIIIAIENAWASLWTFVLGDADNPTAVRKWLGPSAKWILIGVAVFTIFVFAHIGARKAEPTIDQLFSIKTSGDPVMLRLSGISSDIAALRTACIGHTDAPAAPVEFVSPRKKR